ncbi:hypothetical protein M427DRAFT_31452 [Gonapodya prolifera JEL478]|uniref:Uncharacterized protein n=1 Tax=Gonapodya prolifera (strain JEL478) TaxID=1344416 RepID=A0A139AID5_GONPJ|nr:hypothetical protein M427DRAFT_31452 [Gonapodya prolifera JEL478]|eukprot:KXS16304.1 hypothetical protein M427DRAFT_31452 [Gonapodya prolifera JEL478]
MSSTTESTAPNPHSFEQRVETALESVYNGIRSAAIAWGAISGNPEEIVRAPIKDSGWPGRKKRESDSQAAAAGSASRRGGEKDSPVFSNPYYPLSGPPSNPEEHAKLNEYISKEKYAITSTLNDSATSLLRTTSVTAAQENCVDLEFAYRQCGMGRSGVATSTDTPASWWARITGSKLTGCASQEAAWQGCVVRQKRILEDMGFDDKRRPVEELEWILEEADRRFWSEKKQAETK